MGKDPGKILIIDDDEFVLLSLKLLLEQYFDTVTTLPAPERIPATLEKFSYDAILLDMNFKPGETRSTEGLFWLREILTGYSGIPIILMTAFAEIHIAVEAIKEGALDFIVKPWQNEKIVATVKAACALSRERRKVKQLKSQQKAISASIQHHYEDMIGESEAIQTIRKAIEKVAGTDAEVLVLGDNGTGKEVIARAIHKASHRAEGVFISVDVGSLSEQLFESELFGHRKGAFTDAREDRVGRFEAAQGGTLFLDEIANVPIALQAKLLTAIQQKRITRLGSNEPVDIDVRIICATNSDLTKLVREGKFREDLLYRINTVEILVPPLADRRDDIPLLADHFLRKFCRKYHKPVQTISEPLRKVLQEYAWPGNVRELQHAIERAVIMSDEHTLTAQDFGIRNKDAGTNLPADDLNLEGLEAWAIRRAVAKHNGNISHAADELGLSRGAMYRRMEKYGI